MISMLFAAGVLAVVVFAFLGKDVCTQKLSLVMVGSWSMSNLLVDALGYSGASLVLPVLDALCVVYVMSMALKDRCFPCLSVLTLFTLMSLTHVLFHAISGIESWGYWAILNVLFALQLLIVGWWGFNRVDWRSNLAIIPIDSGDSYSSRDRGGEE